MPHGKKTMKEDNEIYVENKDLIRGRHSDLEYSKNEEEETDCGKYTKEVKEGHNALCCDICDTWYHIGCQGVPLNHYEILKSSTYTWICKP